MSVMHIERRPVAPASTMRVIEGWHLWYRVRGEVGRSLVPRPLEPMVRGPWAFVGMAAWRLEEGRVRVQRRVRVQAMSLAARVVRGVYVVDERWAEAWEAVGEAGMREADLWLAELENEPGDEAGASCFPTRAEADRVLREPSAWLASDDGEAVAFRVTPVVPLASAWRARPVLCAELERHIAPAAGAGRLEYAARVGPVTLRWSRSAAVRAMPGRLQAGDLLEGSATSLEHS